MGDRPAASLSVTVSLPEARSAAAGSEAERTLYREIALAEAGTSARFLDPNATFVSLEISGGQLESPILRTASFGTGSRTATLEADGLLAGLEYQVTLLALDTEGGTQLCHGTATVIPGIGANSVAIGVIPDSPLPLVPGPTTTPLVESFAIYRTTLPAAYTYYASHREDGEQRHPLYGIYGPDGRPVPFDNNPASPSYGRFVAAVPGDYYLAVEQLGPSGFYTGVDIVSGQSEPYRVQGGVAVIDGRYVRDSRLPLVLDFDFPVRTVPATSNLGEPDQNVSITGSRVTVSSSLPGGFTPQITAQSGSSMIEVVDDVLGISRSYNFDRGLFKKFFYVRSGGVSTTEGTIVAPCGKLSDAVSLAVAEGDDVSAVVIASGTSTVETVDATILNNNAIVVGGCTQESGFWSRDFGAPRSVVNFPPLNALSFSGVNSNTVVTGVDIRRAGYTGAAAYALVTYSSSSSAVLYDCGVVAAGFSTSLANMDFGVITSGATSTPFIRACRVEYGAITLTAGSLVSAAAYGIRADGAVTVVSSVVRGGSIAWSGTPPSGSYRTVGIGAQLSVIGTTNVIASTVYGGSLGFPDSGSIFTYNLALSVGSVAVENVWLYNSIFLVDQAGDYEYNHAYYTPSNNSVTDTGGGIVSCSFTGVETIMWLQGTWVDSGTLNNYGRVGNTAYTNSIHGFGSFAAGDYRLTAGSPSFLRSGGLDLQASPLGPILVSTAIYDILGNQRDIDSFWSVGAYEYP